jgi:hypothetical protein
MSFLCNAKLGYGSAKKISELSDTNYARLRDGVKSRLRDLLPEDRSTFDADKFPYFNDYIIDAEEATAWTEIADVEVHMSRISGVATPTVNPAQSVYNISVANIGLMQVERVRVEEDCCTDKLQGFLDDGWRLIAVCPPNDARRPSYILGHSNRSAK